MSLQTKGLSRVFSNTTVQKHQFFCAQPSLESNSQSEKFKSQFMEMFKTTDRIRLSEIAVITMGQSPSSETYNTDGLGLPFYQGSADFGDKYVEPRMFCSSPTRLAKAGDVLMSVRAPVGSVNITKRDCCIGRGLAAIRNKKYTDCNDFLLYAFRVMEQEIAAMGQGSTVLSINKDKLHALVMPNATQEQQNDFISFVRQSDKSKFAVLKSSNLNLWRCSKQQIVSDCQKSRL